MTHLYNQSYQKPQSSSAHNQQFVIKRMTTHLLNWQSQNTQQLSLAPLTSLILNN